MPWRSLWLACDFSWGTRAGQWPWTGNLPGAEEEASAACGLQGGPSGGIVSDWEGVSGPGRPGSLRWLRAGAGRLLPGREAPQLRTPSRRPPSAPPASALTCPPAGPGHWGQPVAAAPRPSCLPAHGTSRHQRPRSGRMPVPGVHVPGGVCPAPCPSDTPRRQHVLLEPLRGVGGGRRCDPAETPSRRGTRRRWTNVTRGTLLRGRGTGLSPPRWGGFWRSSSFGSGRTQGPGPAAHEEPRPVSRGARCRGPCLALWGSPLLPAPPCPAPGGRTASTATLLPSGLRGSSPWAWKRGWENGRLGLGAPQLPLPSRWPSPPVPGPT